MYLLIIIFEIIIIEIKIIMRMQGGVEAYFFLEVFGGWSWCSKISESCDITDVNKSHNAMRVRPMITIINFNQSQRVLLPLAQRPMRRTHIQPMS